MFDILLSFIFIILLGYLAKDRIFKKEDKEIFSKFVFNFSLPSLVFSSLYTNSIQGSFWKIIIGVWIIGIIVSIMVLIIGKFLKLPNPTLGSFFLISFCGNVTYMGYPIIEKVFNSEGLIYGIIYDQLGLIPMIYTYGIIILQFLTMGNKINFKLALKRLLVNPPLWGLVLALMLRNISIPNYIIDATKTLGRVTSPMMMFLLGLSLEKSSKNSHYLALFVGIAFKLLFLPYIANQVNHLLGIGGIGGKVMILQSAMPAMLLTLVLSIQYGLDYTFSSQAIFYSTLLSIVTLNFWIGVIK